MVTLLAQRKEGYLQACANAKAEGASSKVRRMERGIKVKHFLTITVQAMPT